MDSNFNEIEEKTKRNDELGEQTETASDYVNGALETIEESEEDKAALKAYKKMKRRATLYGVVTGVLGTIALLLLTIVILVSVGYLGFQRNTGQNSSNNTENQSVISEALEEKIKYMLYIMENNGLNEVDYEALVDGMLHGLVTGLDDDYAAY